MLKSKINDNLNYTLIKNNNYKNLSLQPSTPVFGSSQPLSKRSQRLNALDQDCFVKNDPVKFSGSDPDGFFAYIKDCFYNPNDYASF